MGIFEWLFGKGTNKVFLEHYKQYNISEPTVYDKKQILKILKDIKYQ